MNYGKKNTNRHARGYASANSKAEGKFHMTFWKSLLIGICGFVLFLIVLFGIYSTILIARCPNIKDVDVSPTGYMSKVYDKDGNEIETLAASGANREHATLDKMPEDLQHAFVAIEDERFYYHNGVDIKGVLRAAFTSLVSFGSESQGASTITQQLLKNNYFTQWMSENGFLERFNRKIQEQYLAVQLEDVMSKDEILENYLNTINLGSNTLGVQAASNRYFNKSVSDLNLAESAVIAAITQNPSKYNPITNPENNKTRQQEVLRRMKDQGYITEKEYEDALNDEVFVRISTINNSSSGGGATTYFVDALTEQLADDLMEEKGYSESEAYQKIYSGGLKIYSTQDSAIQAICDEEANNQANYPTKPKISFSYRLTVNKADGTTKNYSDQTMLSYYQHSNPNYTIDFDTQAQAEAAIEKYKNEMMSPGDTIPEGGETVSYTLQPQVAFTVMDQSTGSVVALVGGRGEKDGSKTLNRATDITRQPGSTFKIVTCYAPALDAANMTLATVQNDAPMSYANGQAINNYDFSFRGWTTIREAIQDSINIVAVKTLTSIGTGLGMEYAKNLGITTLVSGDNNQALALGGVTNGVINLELTGAYATIANGGKYYKPTFYTRVEDNSGKLIIDNRKRKSKDALKETTAWLLTSAMKDVMTKGTGTPANFEGMAVAGKSGTTTKNRDTLFAGFTPYYTCVLWGGNDDNAVQGSTSYSKAIWKAVMSRIHKDLPYKDFERPDGITEVAVCSRSGKLPIEGVCDSAGTVYTEYFARGSEPTEQCDHHTSVTLCVESGMIATPYCPETYESVYVDDSIGYCTIHDGTQHVEVTTTVTTVDDNTTNSTDGGNTTNSTNTTNNTTRD